MRNIVDVYADRILDVLIEEGRFVASWGKTLVELARRVSGHEDVQVGDPEYHATSMAVLQLEAHDLVRVERAYQGRHARANVVVAIEVAD